MGSASVATFDSVPVDSADLTDYSDSCLSSSSAATVSPPTAPEFPELDPSAGISLQAISWSPDPARRPFRAYLSLFN
jgi:hypothetical protein